MKRRLNLAAALVHDPALVLLDEPTVGVHPQSRSAILTGCSSCARPGGRWSTRPTTWTRRPGSATASPSSTGRVLALGTLPELLARHGGDPTLIVVEGGVERRIPAHDPAAELSRILSAGRVEDFRVERADLEAVFLHLTGRRLRDA